MSTIGSDLLVVGAGIVGAAIASMAAATGLRVRVVTQLPPGDGATAAGMGHLVVLEDDPAELALCQLSMPLWREFEHRALCEFRACGTLWIAGEPQDLPGLRAKQAALSAAGIATEWLDGTGVAQAEPALRPGLCAGLRVPSDAVVYAPRAAALMLRDACRRHGAQVQAGVAVQAVQPRAVRLADGRVLHADTVVVAGGLGTRTLLPDLPFVPRKGHLAITDRLPALATHQIVDVGYGASAHGDADSVAFNLQPRPTGQLLIGSCRQVGDDSRALDTAMLGRMLQRAVSFMPALADAPVLRCWTGVRPGTFDGRPYIGRWPVLPGVWVAAGHEGLGITTAMGTARLLLDQLLGREPSIDARPFDPARVLLQQQRQVA